MKARRFTLAILMYVSLDLSSPFVPGAFNFNPDECVDGIRRAPSPHERADASAVTARVPVARLVVRLPSPGRPSAGSRHPVLEWLIDSRGDIRASGDPPPPSEDH